MVYSVGKCRLNKILSEKNMSQSELAIKVNMSRQQIFKYANNENIMTLKNAINISRALNVNIEDLYEIVWSRKQ